MIRYQCNWFVSLYLQVTTVPQGVIDLNKCSDVYDAESITSHAYSIAVATPEHTTYIKGSAKEETNRYGSSKQT